MLSQATFTAIRTFFKLYHLIRAGPFMWSDRTGRLALQSSLIDWCLLGATYLWLVCRVIHVQYSIFTAVILHKGIGPITSSLTLVVWYSAVLIYQINALKHRSAIVAMINNLFEFNRLTAMYLIGTEKPVKRDGTAKFIWAVFSFAAIMALIMVFSLYRKNPLNPRFFYRFIANTPDRSLLFYCYGTLELITQMWFWFPWLLVLISAWIYAKSTAFWLKQLRYGANRTLLNRPKLVISVYQQLQVLNIQFNHCFSSLGMPAFVFHNVMTHCTGLFVILKLHERLPLSVLLLYVVWFGIAWFYIEGTLYSNLGSVNYFSRKLLRSWYAVLGVKGRKRLQALPSLSVKIGSIYAIKRTTVLMVYDIIVTITVQMLLIQ